MKAFGIKMPANMDTLISHRRTALIVGVGGIGHETARLCDQFGMRVIGVDPRWEYEVPFVEKHEPAELDTLPSHLLTL